MLHTPTQYQLLNLIPEGTNWQHLAFLPDVICESLLEMAIANLGSGLQAIQANVKLTQLAAMTHTGIIDLWNTHHPGAELNPINKFVNVSLADQAFLKERSVTHRWLRYTVFEADKVLVLCKLVSGVSYATHVYYPSLDAHEYGHYIATKDRYAVMASFEQRLQEHLT